MKQQILVLLTGKIYGPFPDQETAGTWTQNHSGAASGEAEMYSFWQPAALGTADKAHECGTRLVGIEEASTDRTDRKASGA